MAVIRIHRRRTLVKVFRPSFARLPVQQVHLRFMDFFRILRKMKSLWEKAGESLRRGPNEGVQIGNQKCLRRCESNVFYAEAIADCLEFIKRTSLQVETEKNTARLTQ